MIGEEHDEAVDADAFAGGRRHAVFEGAQKILVDSMGFFVPGFMLGGLGFESLTLIERVIQFREGVGDFTARNIELETIGERRIRVFPARQRRNLNRVVRDEGWLLQTRLNGQVLQDANTRDMIFDVATLVSVCSEPFALQPGDIIIAGTPSGVGLARKPQVFMKAGDVCEVEIEGVGLLSNPVVDGA